VRTPKNECIAIPDAMTKNVSKSKGFPEAVKQLAYFVDDLPLLAQDDVHARHSASTLVNAPQACVRLHVAAN
jgi:hypothetical protein